jgi:ABC-type nickel/cobalt efflux system permease component RcnA
MTEVPNQDDPRMLHEAQINNALGVFLAFFGLVVLISIFFTDTRIGKLTNLGAGALIVGIGAAMMYRAYRLKRPR